MLSHSNDNLYENLLSKAISIYRSKGLKHLLHSSFWYLIDMYVTSAYYNKFKILSETCNNSVTKFISDGLKSLNLVVSTLNFDTREISSTWDYPVYFSFIKYNKIEIAIWSNLYVSYDAKVSCKNYVVKFLISISNLIH